MHNIKQEVVKMFKTNKMGRKIVAGLTITAMLASLAGCSGSTGSSGDTSDGSSDTSGGDLPILELQSILQAITLIRILHQQ